MEGFISELLNRDIHIVSLLESEGNKNNHEDKYNRIDVLARNEKDEMILIEVQASREWDYLSRILYGTSKAITEHIKEGDPYKNICKVISISIVFFDMGEGDDYIYQGTTVFKGRHRHDILKLNKNEKNTYGLGFETPADVYPEYYIVKVNQFRERIQNKFDEWMYFLKNEQIKSNFKAKGIHSAAEKLSVLKLTEQERRSYERYQENLHYEASMILSQKVEGKVEGFSEGIKKVASSLKSAGFSIDEIKAHTSLSEDKIENL